MTRLSVVIITHNEEQNIARCLESIRGVADEIVVVDSFSTDKTRAICQKHGARFIRHKFEGHIEQKNFAMRQAKSPYILSLDADEALSPELRQSILDVKNNWASDGYRINRLTNYCGAWIRHCGWYPDTKLRLLDARKGRWSGTNPHDRFEMRDHDTRLGILNGDILHYSYNSISGHLKQVDYFTEISAKELHAKGNRATMFQILTSPVFRFLRDYFWKRGFLDGYYGLIICAISSQASFLKYAKLRELSRNS